MDVSSREIEYAVRENGERTNGLCDCVNMKELVRTNMFKSVLVVGRTCQGEIKWELNCRRCVLPGDSWNNHRPIRSAC